MGHTVVSAYGWGTSVQDMAVARGAQPLFDDSVRLMAADPEVEVLDERFCQATSSKTNSQCQAYPKKDEVLCAGHLNAEKKKQREAAEE